MNAGLNSRLAKLEAAMVAPSVTWTATERDAWRNLIEWAFYLIATEGPAALPTLYSRLSRLRNDHADALRFYAARRLWLAVHHRVSDEAHSRRGWACDYFWRCITAYLMWAIDNGAEAEDLQQPIVFQSVFDWAHQLMKER